MVSLKKTVNWVKAQKIDFIATGLRVLLSVNHLKRASFNKPPEQSVSQQTTWKERLSANHLKRASLSKPPERSVSQQTTWKERLSANHLKRASLSKPPERSVSQQTTWKELLSANHMKGASLNKPPERSVSQQTQFSSADLQGTSKQNYFRTRRRGPNSNPGHPKHNPAVLTTLRTRGNG
jgi:hypothetical protein